MQDLPSLNQQELSKVDPLTLVYLARSAWLNGSRPPHELCQAILDTQYADWLWSACLHMLPDEFVLSSCTVKH